MKGNKLLWKQYLVIYSMSSIWRRIWRLEMLWMLWSLAYKIVHMFWTKRMLMYVPIPLFDVCSFRLTLTQDLREFLSKKPFIYHDEMQSFLFDEYNIQVNLITLNQELSKTRISRKKIFSIIFIILKFTNYNFNQWLYSEMQS